MAALILITCRLVGISEQSNLLQLAVLEKVQNVLQMRHYSLSCENALTLVQG